MMLHVLTIVLSLLSMVADDSRGVAGGGDEAPNYFDALTAEQKTVVKPWMIGGFGRPEVSTVDLTETYAQLTEAPLVYSMSPTFIVFRDAMWSKEDVIDDMTKTAKIFAQCGIKITAATLVVANSPTAVNTVRGISDRLDIVDAVPSGAMKPYVFYYQSDDSSPTPYALLRRFQGGGLLSTPRVERSFDTAWIPRLAVLRLQRSAAKPPPEFSNAGRLLATIFIGSNETDTTDQPNLLATYPNRFAPDLKPQQCNRILGSKLVRHRRQGDTP